MANQTNSSLTISNVTYGKEGYYRCVLVNYGGLVISREAHLQPNGGVSSAPGRFDALAASFAGSSDYLAIADNQQSGLAFNAPEAAATIALWYKPNALDRSTIGLLSKVYSNTDPYGYMLALLQTGQVYWQVNASSPAIHKS